MAKNKTKVKKSNKRLIYFHIFILIAWLIGFYGLIDGYNDLVDDYNKVVDQNNDLRKDVKEIQDEHKEIVGLYDKRYDDLYENYDDLYSDYEDIMKKSNYTWTGCRNSRTIVKFCKGCDYELVCSESMRPTFSCENILSFCKAQKEEIKIGDIIAFNTYEYENDDYDYEHFFTIHRVINITPEGFQTKGDGNIYVDNEITHYSQILGKLWKIEGG